MDFEKIGNGSSTEVVENGVERYTKIVENLLVVRALYTVIYGAVTYVIGRGALCYL